MGGRVPKQYLKVAGRTLLEWSVEPFLRCPWIKGVVVVLSAEDRRFESLPLWTHRKLHTALGAEARAGSVLAGLDCIAQQRRAREPMAYALVHDAARPCVQMTDIRRLRDAASDRHGGLLAVPAVDTLKQSVQGRAQRTLDRAQIWQAQTPQMFRLDVLRKALSDCAQRGLSVTDEASAMEQAGFTPRLVTASAGNLKVTYPEDLKLAEFWLSRRKFGA